LVKKKKKTVKRKVKAKIKKAKKIVKKIPKKVKCRPIAGGVVEGEALVSKSLFGWLGGVNPKTGDIIDKRLDVYGQNLKGKIFIYPYGRGSTTGAAVFLETIRNGVGPAALVNVEMEPITAVGALLAPVFYGVKVPAVDKPKVDPTEVFKTGDIVRVDGDKGIIELVKRGGEV